jgi:hypothetical protein
MSRFFLALLAVLCLGAAVGPQSAHAQDGVATFGFVNSTRYKVYVKMFSKSRTWVWPSSTTSWPLDDSEEHNFRLTCEVGEKICFGAFWADGRSWGVGRYGRDGCTQCCLTCNTPDQDPSHTWDLIE